MNELSKNTELQQSCITAVSGSVYLTGICAKDFENQFCGIITKNNLELSAFIIEWLDSKDFFINVEVIKDKMLGYVRGFDSDITFTMHGELTNVNSDCLKKDIYETRNEATLKAIQKASEVYNHIFCEFSQTDG